MSTFLRKKRLILAIQLIVLILSLLSSGCATTGYLGDRVRDANDIFTATVGKGAGLKARVGIFSTGIFENSDYAGLRNGMLFINEKKNDMKVEDYTSIIYRKAPPLYYFVGEHCRLGGDSKLRHKDFKAMGFPLPLLTFFLNEETNAWVYSTQIEVAFGIGGTVRVGFNPVELIDFFLGWTTVDIFNDDLQKKANKSINSD